MARVNTDGQMDLFTKVSGSTISQTAMARNQKMETYTMVNLSEGTCRGMDVASGQMGAFT